MAKFLQVCEAGENKRLLLSTFMMLGLLVGSPIGGRLGDRFGRKPVMVGALVNLFISCPIILSSVTPWGGLTVSHSAFFCLSWLIVSQCPVLRCWLS